MGAPPVQAKTEALRRLTGRTWVRRSLTIGVLGAWGVGVVAVAGATNVTPTIPLIETSGQVAAAPPITTTPPVEVPPEVTDALTVDSGKTAASRTKKVPKVKKGTVGDIPPLAYYAYRRAAQVMDSAAPECHLDWSLLAAIGRIESNHGQHSGNELSRDGAAEPGIYGPQLTKISDTDAGELDSDARFDRAVGPMQFIPTTWAAVAVDGNGDDVRDPQNIHDAALAAGVYLCVNDRNLANSEQRRAAVWSYNHSDSYVAAVLSLAADYKAAERGGEMPETTSVGDTTVRVGWTPGGTTVAGPPTLPITGLSSQPSGSVRQPKDDDYAFCPFPIGNPWLLPPEDRPSRDCSKSGDVKKGKKDRKKDRDDEVVRETPSSLPETSTPSPGEVTTPGPTGPNDTQTPSVPPSTTPSDPAPSTPAPAEPETPDPAPSEPTTPSEEPSTPAEPEPTAPSPEPGLTPIGTLIEIAPGIFQDEAGYYFDVDGNPIPAP